MKILSIPKGNAEEYGRWSVNPYLGCKHGCNYCYLKKGVWVNTLGGNVPRLKQGIIDSDHAYYLAMVEIHENAEQIKRDGGLFMSFTTDPCLPETIRLFSNINFFAQGRHHIPVTILTKCAYMEKSVMPGIPTRPFFCKFSTGQRLLALGWTLTGHDELEPNAAPNEERIEYMRMASEAGHNTWASIEPVIDFPSSLDMVAKAADAGCQHFKIGLLTNNSKVCRKQFDVDKCVEFINQVTELTCLRATVYWKQSVRDLLLTKYSPESVDFILDQPYAVGKDWSMFDN